MSDTFPLVGSEWKQTFEIRRTEFGYTIDEFHVDIELGAQTVYICMKMSITYHKRNRES